jgi:hypothetical protein
MIHDRNIDLTLALFGNIAHNKHLTRWWGLAASEVVAQGLTPFLGVMLWNRYPACHTDCGSLSCGSALKKLLSIGLLLTLKDRFVDGIRRCGQKNDENLKNITTFFAEQEALKTSHVLEPGATVTKTIIVRKEDYKKEFVVRLTSHDYTTAAHTIDFDVVME